MNHNEALKHIGDAAAYVVGVEPDDLTGPSRRLRIVRARHVAMSIAHRDKGIPYVRIGQFFDRDHSSVIHAVKSIANESAYNALLRRTVREVRFRSRYIPTY